MPNHYTETVDLDADIEEYLGIALYAQSGGFSRGTANVSHHDVQKLKGLLKYYAKKPHPFAACVRDNRKRFGSQTEKYCAVLKDLIVGNTKWRGKGKKSAKGKNLSEETLVEIYSLDIPDEFYGWLKDVEFEENEVEFATGDVAWNAENSWNAIRSKIEEQLNAGDSGYDGMGWWVKDVSGNEALVCGGQDHYVVPFSMDKGGTVTLADETDWKVVDQAWVETEVKFSQPEQMAAEMYFSADDGETEISEDGLIWKTILREGTWRMSPGPGQKPMPKPITVVKTGLSDPRKLVISMDELKHNFESGVVEHVTIPTSHDDRVHENTGFVKGLRFGKDSKGREILQAAHHFTEPEIKDKTLRGTIANTSAGVLFDYVNKETGKKHSAVLGHVALTNHPWLNDMNPFGVLASENVKVLAFSEDSNSNPDRVSGGGDKMPEETVLEETVETTPSVFERLGLSEEELVARLDQFEELQRRDREHQIQAQVDKWQDAKKSPALIAEAKTLLSAASETETVLNLSEDGKTVGLTAVDIIERLMEVAPSLELAEDQVSEEQQTSKGPEMDATEEIKLSEEENTLAAQLFFAGMSRADAAKEALRRYRGE